MEDMEKMEGYIDARDTGNDAIYVSLDDTKHALFFRGQIIAVTWHSVADDGMWLPAQEFTAEVVELTEGMGALMMPHVTKFFKDMTLSRVLLKDRMDGVPGVRKHKNRTPRELMELFLFEGPYP